jgi:hypothetical protein
MAKGRRLLQEATHNGYKQQEMQARNLQIQCGLAGPWFVSIIRHAQGTTSDRVQLSVILTGFISTCRLLDTDVGLDCGITSTACASAAECALILDRWC